MTDQGDLDLLRSINVGSDAAVVTAGISERRGSHSAVARHEVEDTVNGIVKVKADLLEVDGGVTLDGAVAWVVGHHTSEAVGRKAGSSQISAAVDVGQIGVVATAIVAPGTVGSHTKGQSDISGARSSKGRGLADDDGVRDNITLDGQVCAELTDDRQVVTKAITVKGDGLQAFGGRPTWRRC